MEKVNTQEKVDRYEALDDESECKIEERHQYNQKKFGNEQGKALLLSQTRQRRKLVRKSELENCNEFDYVLDDEIDKVVNILSAPKISPQNLVAQLRKLITDDSDLVIVLRALIRRNMLHEKKRKKITDVLSYVEQTSNKKRLKSGINVALKARIFSSKIDVEPYLLRESYRQFIETDLYEIQIYGSWISTYGTQNRKIILQFIENATITDINSNDPSCSRIEFGNLLSRLNQIKTIKSCDKFFILSLINYYKSKAIPFRELNIVLFFIGVLEEPNATGDFLDLLLKVDSGNEDKRKITQLIYNLIKKLPLCIFINTNDKEIIKDQLIEKLNNFFI
ncbi:type III secretion system gatekeeper subunit SctW [Candidatus Arsenophonus triatominarum]|uniref:type III secretion system gatekeeper subunit SctW n=1 Tax=Candidatus Arsenophonus triatominarum TaxID=57911 RepID=UPI0016505F70|nr:type III secretion system gatekeeper subunit SctW [Candidatus Arsenophonus triatominarum]